LKLKSNGMKMNRQHNRMKMQTHFRALTLQSKRMKMQTLTHWSLNPKGMLEFFFQNSIVYPIFLIFFVFFPFF